VDHNVRQLPESVSQSETDLVGVVFNTTRQDSPDLPETDAHCDNPAKPTAPQPEIALDVQRWVQLSGTKINTLIANGDIPRDRLLELADAEQILQPTGRARMSYVQKWTQRYYDTPTTVFKPMFAAICEAFGYDIRHLTRNERGQVGAAAKALIEADRTPDDVQAIYDYCKRQGWSSGFGPGALLNHASAALKAQQAQPVEWPCAECGDMQGYGEGHLCNACYAASEKTEPDGHAFEPDGLDEVVNGCLTLLDVWRGVLGQLELQLGPTSFSQHLTGVEPVQYDDGVATIYVPPFRFEQFKQRLGNRIERDLQQWSGRLITVEFVTDAAPVAQGG
jgi:hypothetical protein